jgi:hypothetical protein
VRAQAEHPRDDPAGTRVPGQQYTILTVRLDRVDILVEVLLDIIIIFLAGVDRLARDTDPPVAAEVALDLPGDPLGDQYLRHAPLLAQLPVGAVGVRARW